MKYILRLIVLPFFIVILAVFHAKEILKRSYLFVLHGGEFIVYERKNQNKLINDIFEQIVTKNQQTNENRS